MAGLGRRRYTKRSCRKAYHCICRDRMTEYPNISGRLPHITTVVFLMALPNDLKDSYFAYGLLGSLSSLVCPGILKASRLFQQPRRICIACSISPLALFFSLC